jgi:hypothetical protein
VKAPTSDEFVRALHQALDAMGGAFASPDELLELMGPHLPPGRRPTVALRVTLWLEMWKEQGIVQKSRKVNAYRHTRLVRNARRASNA